ncbi:conserved repeat domain-containing protein/gliding motility-associated C-terminal domain-containing protein, partial [Algoriphagus faecimaris]
SLSTVGQVTYFAAAVNDETGCESLTRTPVTLTINPAPVAPISGGNQSSCLIEEGQILTANATVPAGFSVVWYTSAEGGATTANPSLSTVGSVTYYAAAVNNETGCESLTRTPVTLTFDTCEISIEKTADVDFVNLAGQEINYTLVVTNPGTADLTNVVVNDPLTDFTQVIPVLAAGASVELETSYTVTQENIDFGSITNTATVVGNSAETEVSDESSAVVNAEQNPDITIVITDNDADITEAGQEIDYTITVTNTGNVTLENVTIVDSQTGLVINVGTLQPGESTSVDTSYEVDQVDVDNGSVTNEASVTGESPNAGDDDPTATDTVTTPITPVPSINLIKSADKDAVSEAGELITYTLTATNTGNVTLSDVTITDPLTGLEEVIETMAPGEVVELTTTYTVTQEDLDSGEIVNVAVAEGQSPDETPVSDEATETVESLQLPAIEMVKTSDTDEIQAAGQVIIYTLTVTNTGNVTLTDIVVTDPMTGLEVNVATLSPGTSEVIETEYVVTESDLEELSLVNVATVTATTPDDTEVEDSDDHTIGIGPREIIANDDDFGTYFVSYGGRLGNILENDLLDGQRPDPADVDFEFTELDGVIGLLIDEDGELSLIPGVNEAREYNLEYILRETVFPSNSDDAKVVFRLLNDNVNLSITKEATQEIIFEGDEFEYEIVVSNIGGFDARNVVITDQLPSGVEYISNEVASNSSNAEVSTTVTGSTITWTIGFFPADATITFIVRVKAGAAGSVTNTAVVGAEEEDTDESDNEATDVSQIRPFRIPNVITPNGDGDNDTFEIQGLGKFVSNTITIFNRFGDHVLERDNYNNDWDAPGQVAGTYFYVLVAVDESGREHEFKGWIQVIKD